MFRGGTFAGTPAGVRIGPDESAVTDVVRPLTPVAWAYADVSYEGVDVRGQRVRHLAALLTEADAPPAAAAVICERMTTSPVMPARLAVFADSGGAIREMRFLPPDAGEDRAGYSLPADVVPVLAADQRRPPYVSVVIDRAGADLTYSRGGAAADLHHTVTGTDDEIHRSVSGGWADLAETRLFHRATDSWLHNARTVAHRVVACAEDVGAQVLLVAGERQSVHLLLDELPSELASMVRPVSGSRAAEGSRAEHRDRLRAELACVAAEQTDELLEYFAGMRSPGGLAVEGVAATVAALEQGRVATLLIDPARVAGFAEVGLTGTEIALARDGTDEPTGGRVRVPLSGAAIRSALLSGGRVRVLTDWSDDAPAEGIGALCRFRAVP